MATDSWRDQGLVVLAAVPTELEAAVLVNTLAGHGIQATATGGYTSGFKAEAPGDVRVLVKNVDLDVAREVLQEIRTSSVDSQRPEVWEADAQEVAPATLTTGWLLLIATLLLVIFLICLWLLSRHAWT